jgi:hypothetical protein
MPTGPINYLTQASGGADETTYYLGNISPTNLVIGVNVLAVEIHQSSGSSGDISFNLRLDGVIRP